MWWCHNVDWSWWGWLGMGLWMLVVWAAVIVLAVFAIRHVLGSLGERRDDHGLPDARAEALLAERYARGEIDDEELEHRRSRLREQI